MTDVLTLTQALRGCEVTAQASPDMTVAVAAGFVLVDNVVVPCAAGNVTITTADATQDRTDAIVVDSSGAKSAVAGSVNDGANAAAPDVTDALLAYVYVLSQAHPDYTADIVPEVVIDQRDFAPVDEPTQSMTYTSAGGSLSDADPGTGLLGFDGSTFSGVTQIYASYLSPSVARDNRDLLTTNKPYYLRLFQKSNPENWSVYKVTATTNHTNYVTLDVAFYMAGTTLQSVGARGGLALSTLGSDPADLVVERTYMPADESGSSALGGDVTMTNANQFYDGPNTGALTGTFLVTTYVTALGGVGSTMTARVWDGSTTYAEASQLGGAVIGDSIHLSVVVTLSAQTLKLSIASTVAAGTIKANPTSNSSAANVATRISWVRVA